MAYIEWTGKSYTHQINNLHDALTEAENYVENNGLSDEAIAVAENLFAKIAFEGWHTVPDNWTLVFG